MNGTIPIALMDQLDPVGTLVTIVELKSLIGAGRCRMAHDGHRQPNKHKQSLFGVSCISG